MIKGYMLRHSTHHEEKGMKGCVWWTHLDTSHITWTHMDNVDSSAKRVANWTCLWDNFLAHHSCQCHLVVIRDWSKEQVNILFWPNVVTIHSDWLVSISLYVCKSGWWAHVITLHFYTFRKWEEMEIIPYDACKYLLFHLTRFIH